MKNLLIKIFGKNYEGALYLIGTILVVIIALDLTGIINLIN